LEVEHDVDLLTTADVVLVLPGEGGSSPTSPPPASGRDGPA
jgi:hypothetical protein